MPERSNPVTWHLDFAQNQHGDALVTVAWAFRGESGNGFRALVILRTDPKTRLAVDPISLP